MYAVKEPANNAGNAGSGMFIPDSDLDFLPISDTVSRIQGKKAPDRGS